MATGLFVVLALFCAPLFVALDGTDLRSDEAIYTYAVDRMLETGEWLTPRSIQVDGPFLEKPPLKFWMVAAAIGSGLVPHDEVGYRLLDAVMGAIAFVYIYLIGVRVGGPVCGVVAVLVTFSVRPIAFDHGLRSNNMEAPLFLAYCAGVYHFLRWVEDDRRPRAHAVAVGLYFALGFMTKFVAVAFLPVVLAASLVGLRVLRARLVARWRDWVPTIAIAAIVIAPWFVYETLIYGRYFWEVILGTHVVTRFTSSLDPAHLRPWPFYFTQLAEELSGNQLALGIASVTLAVAGWRGRPWQMRVVALWCVIPLALISLGTSKLFHYAYPFLPPVGIAAGLAAARLLDFLRRRAASVALPSPGSRALRRVLLATAFAAVALALASAVTGQVQLRIGGVRLLQTSTVTRPLLVAAMAMAAAGSWTLSAQTIGALAIALVLPVTSYPGTVRLADTRDTRLRTVRDCAIEVQHADPVAARGVYNAARGLTHHAQYYYLFRTGAWHEPENVDHRELERRLFTPGQQTLVFVTLDEYERMRRLAADGAIVWLPPAVEIDGTALVMPGPYASCANAVRAAGAQAPGKR